jgi:hypothetical protein
MKSAATHSSRMCRAWYITACATLVLAGVPQYSKAQTASSLSNLAGENPSAASSTKAEISGNNPWIAGAQLGYKFAGEGDFTDNLLVAGTVMYKIPLIPDTPTSWNLPVFTNIASLAADAAAGKSKKDSLEAAGNALLSSAQGIFVRLAPYRVLRAATNTRTTFFSSIGGKVNSLAAKDTSAGKQELLQGRISAGLELALGAVTADTASRPLTISVAAVRSYFSGTTYKKIFGGRRTMIPSGEMTVILPVQTGTAVLAEAVMAKGFRPAIRLGLLIAKKG